MSIPPFAMAAILLKALSFSSSKTICIMVLYFFYFLCLIY